VKNSASTPDILRTAERPGAKERRSARRILAAYVLIATAWLLLSSGVTMLVLPGVKLGDIQWMRVFAEWFFLGSTGWLLYLLISRSLDAARSSADAIRLRDQAIESSVNAVVIAAYAAESAAIVYVNPAFERITGFAAAEVLGRDCLFLYGADGDQPGLDNLRFALREQRDGSGVVRNYRKDGTQFWNEIHLSPVRDSKDVVTHYVGILNDVTDAKRYQEELERKANFDELTGLANRNFLRDMLASGIAYAKRHDKAMTVMFVDLDHFKLINDSLGHAVGDELLRQVAARLRTCVRDSDITARQSGDEFVLLLNDEGEDAAIAEMARRVLAAVVQPYELQGSELFLSCSIGYAVFPRDGDSSEILLRNADAAMYRAKEAGRNTWQAYSPEMDSHAAERLTMEGRLRHATARGQLFLLYQPIVDLGSAEVTAVEALLRWQHPDYGLVMPARFIALAEETGLIVPMGEWILREACRQSRAWDMAGLAPIRMAVNLSARQFRQPGLVERIAGTLAESGMEGNRLELEITESMVMHNPEKTRGILERLVALGITMAMDDFGTGYSSLAYLKHFPIHYLKIDRSFVDGIPDNAGDVAIVRTILGMAQSLQLRVIAEGIEQPAQADMLRAGGCQEAQGYYFGKPMPAEDVEKMLRVGAAR
jgi:diguanylate cyclase (GGDEF)-like protein/PAS domain S-box-containing protein